MELSKEEKLRQRQERLAAFRKKKEDSKSVESQSVKIGSNGNQVTANGNELSEPKTKLALKIEQWKQKRLKTSDPTTIALKKLKAAPRHHKRAAFDLDDEEILGPKTITFKEPSLSMKYGADDSEGDELDAYLKDLESKNDSKENLESVEISEALDGNIESEDEYSGESEDELSKLKLQNRTKDLGKLDHDNIDYKDFKKVFYKEVPPTNFYSEDELSILLAQIDNIKTTGHKVPHPIFNWMQLNLSPAIIETIDRLEYHAPTPIQSQALPAILSGRDVIGIANTGSGKTLAFVLPLLRHVMDQPRVKKGEGPIALVLSPTRELSLQIHKEISHFEGVSAGVYCGGTSIEPHIGELKRGVDIMIGTPGRVIDLLAANNGRVTNLKRTTFLVLDEADRMFDSGFEPQVLKIMSQIRPDRQTVLFSATFPRKMEMLALRNLTDPIQIIVGGIGVVTADVTQKVEVFDSETYDTDRFASLVRILTEIEGKVLVFVDRQAGADELLVKLLREGFDASAIHGGKDQIDRKHTIKEFSSINGKDILIATSVAARGLDVKNLKLVINYDPANHLEDYVHRVGRTGRAGNKGIAITFLCPNQIREIKDVIRAMTLSGVEIPPELKDFNDDKVKANFGFGGRGLAALQEARQSNKEMQRKLYDEPKPAETTTAKEENSKENTPFEADLPDFHIIEGRAPETSGPDKCKFHARVTVNDLPQKARWIVVNAENLSKIIESTSCSITIKGQYYPPNAKPKNDQPKLYLLVEGLTEVSVQEANNMIRQNMIEGLKLTSKEKPIGRYEV